MVNTNAFLKIGLALVAHFAAAVHLPPAAVPHSTNDLAKWSVGSPPRTPILVLGFETRDGALFAVQYGAVHAFRTRDSYFAIQDPDLIPGFVGRANFSSNQVVAIAGDALRRLSLHGDPTKNLPLRVESAGRTRDGQDIPFYRLRWLDTNNVTGQVAQVEVDARDGAIVSVFLTSGKFCDFALARRIKSEVYHPDIRRRPKPVQVPSVHKRMLPAPTTNELVRVFHNWRRVCRRLGINPGSQTNVVDVNWRWTCLVPKDPEYWDKDTCEVKLTNGTRIWAREGKVYKWTAWDLCFGFDWIGAPAEHWTPFVGRINYDWKTLAERFSDKLVRRFGFPRSVVAQYTPGARWFKAAPSVRRDPYRNGPTSPPAVGTTAVTRVLVSWDKLPAYKLGPHQFYPLSKLIHGWSAEMDTHTGQVKAFYFGLSLEQPTDKHLTDLFLRAQAKWK
jgi:hypothetical protein